MSVAVSSQTTSAHCEKDTATVVSEAPDDDVADDLDSVLDGKDISFPKFQGRVHWPIYINTASKCSSDGIDTLQRLLFDRCDFLKALHELGYVLFQVPLTNLPNDTVGYLHASKASLQNFKNLNGCSSLCDLSAVDQTGIIKAIKDALKFRCLLRTGKLMRTGDFCLPLIHRLATAGNEDQNNKDEGGEGGEVKWGCTFFDNLLSDPVTLTRQLRTSSQSTAGFKRKRKDEAEEKKQEKKAQKSSQNTSEQLEATVELFGGQEAVNGIVQYLEWSEKMDRKNHED